MNKSGGKLSKRHNDVSVEEYRRKGYLPKALLNFVVLLGWHPRSDKEILTLEEIIQEFDIKNLKKSSAVFDTEKLDYLNGYYIRQMDKNELAEKVTPYLQENLKNTKNKHKKSKEFIQKVAVLEQERLKKLSDIIELTDFFFADELEYNKELLLWKKLNFQQIKSNLKLLQEIMEKIKEKNWTQDNLEKQIVDFIKENDYQVGDFLWPLRVSLTGKKQSPGPFEVAAILGKNESLERVKHAIAKI